MSFSPSSLFTLPPLVTSFFLLGLLNNSSYVIMIAGAKNISEGSVALVFLSNVLPSFLCKLTSPLWFHKVTYSKRINACMALMTLSFLVVGYFEDYRVKLAGVCAASLQSGLGEASILALTSRYPSPSFCLTAWSSGTGMAGIFGFAWVVVFQPLGFTFTLALANLLSVMFGAVFYFHLPRPEGEEWGEEDTDGLLEKGVDNQDVDSPKGVERKKADGIKPASLSQNMTISQRCAFTSKLSKYMVPLFVVYFAEYAMQSGTWAAIGFPVEDEHKRKEFYQWANWTYQAGVFVSRSSGTVYKPSLTTVQLMPVLQTGLLVLFYAIAYYQFMYSYILLVPCFVVGLLGGLVYVNAFNLISKEVEKGKTELALATASVADSCGIMMSDVTGLFLQACLYEHHGIEGAKVKCF